jgi:hypothetical protein
VKITVTIPPRLVNPFQVGKFVKIKKHRKSSLRFAIIISVRDDNGSFGCTLQGPDPYKVKNGFFVDRLRGIYDNKPKIRYFNLNTAQ